MLAVNKGGTTIDSSLSVMTRTFFYELESVLGKGD